MYIDDKSAKCGACNTYREGYKTFSWLGFFFSNFYYAGKNLKKATIITIIYLLVTYTLDYIFSANTLYGIVSGALYFIILGTYVGITVTKEPLYIQKKFNWKHANLLALVLLIVSIIYLILTFKHTNPEEYQMLMQLNR